VLERVGLSAAPADAVEEVRARVHWVSGAPGGRGAVRELIEVVLRAQGRWEALVAFYTGEAASSQARRGRGPGSGAAVVPRANKS
jgi:3-deoxy-D-manno-octulosonate 8-phosphate phosphatase (KDO 8-P phosphatase)